MGSTVSRNVKNITCKYDVPTKTCHGTYSSVKNFITITCKNNVSIDTKTSPSIIAESVDICVNTMNYRPARSSDRINHNDANNMIIYLATI